MRCKACNEMYDEKFVDDFVDEVCLPCQSQAWHDQWERDVEKELKVLNDLLNKEYDFDNFCYDCWVGPEKLLPGLSLSKTPILIDVYDRELTNKQEYYNTLTQHAQQNLF